MTTKRKLIATTGVLFLLFCGWYLGFKENDYTINFKVKAATGTVFQGIQEWTNLLANKQKEKYVVLEKRNYDFLKQEITAQGYHKRYTWEICGINDTVTEVSVGVKDLNHSWYNKLTVPFFSTNFKEKELERVKDFRKGLNEHLKTFKVVIDGENSSQKTWVAYINLKSIMQEKGQTMIANDALITGFLHNNNIKIQGRPYVEIVSWDSANEILNFNYCFPVDTSVKAITHDKVKFKMIPAIKGLQATYFGNFRTSDRAWFALKDYAKKRNLKLEDRVLEHFLANPFNGGDELEWETKVIIPFTTNKD
jgi:effector-binding domain-containing protein